MAAASATEKALVWLSFVISFHTVCISLAQNTASQRASQMAHIHIIQKGIPILFTHMVPLCIISFIAARGHIALATSFAP